IFPWALAHVRKTVSPSGYRGLRAFDSLSLARSESGQHKHRWKKFDTETCQKKRFGYTFSETHGKANQDK
ncbi:hypothetical protein, partial [Solemya elarraichensis gill symbiont]|uniref:hypothetical protein n=1 Tax=Solemya elarraichensis gill symbiont TaxID=1918949 RepID=UPI001C2C2ED5